MLPPTSRRALLVAFACGLFACQDQAAPQPSAEAKASASASASAVPVGPKVHQHEALSEVWKVDEVWKSMQGPASVQHIKLGGSGKRELLWIVGFEATMVDADGKTPASQEFMCHTNLDVNVEKHQAQFASEKPITGRLFTLSQGQHRIDLPKGTGIPVMSDEALALNTQVLNLNMKEGEKRVRHKIIFRYMRDADVDQPMRALYVAGAYGLKLLAGKDGHYGLEGKGHHDHNDHHTACLPGANAGKNEFDDGKGRTFTGHWVVKPGREVNHTRVTELMDLPFDTTIHYIAVHLHPFAESLALRDLTTGKTVWTAKTRQADKGIGLAHVDHFTSTKGIKVYKNHEYEIVSVYNNTTDEDQDSMAVFNLYMADHEFKKPDLTKGEGSGVRGQGSGSPASRASAKPAASANPGM